MIFSGKHKNEPTGNRHSHKLPFAIKIVSVTTVSVLLLAIILGAVYFARMNLSTSSANDLPDELKGISPISSVTATDYNGSRITQNTRFKITTSRAMSKNDFKSAFSISPNINYKLVKNTGNTFTVSFSSGLKSDTLYSLSSSLEGKTVYSWAYQTDSSFKIVAHSPNSDYADKNSSVTVDFSNSDVENFEECFSIFPSTPGTFEHYGRRWVFVPSVEFDSDTLYTVTISKNISSGGQALNTDYSFSFICNDKESYLHLKYNEMNSVDTFTTSQVPVALFEYNNIDLSKARVSVFKTTSPDTYADILQNLMYGAYVSQKVEEKLGEFQQTLSFDAKPLKNTTENKDFNTASLNYPEQLDTGYYVSKITFGDTVLYHIFQVSDLSVYSVSSNGDCTVWVNNITEKSSVQGTSVKIGALDEIITDTNGIAVFKDTVWESETDILRVTSEGTLPYISRINTTTNQDYRKAALDYYSYLYTDSEIYRPGDTINVWGFLLNRRDDATLPENLQIYCEWNDSYINIEADEMGGFDLQIELSNTSVQTYTTLALYADNQLITQSGFYISDYNLPTYKLEIETDKNAYFSGEEIEYTLHAYTYDGMPASNVTVLASFNDGKETKLQTNEVGVAIFSRKAVYNTYSAENSAPQRLYTGFTVTEPDGTSTYASCAVVIFDTDLTTVITRDNSDINISLYSVDLTKLNSTKVQGINAYDEKSYIGLVYDATLQIELHKVSYNKTVTNQENNTQNENVDNTYDYEQKDETVSVGSVNTENGTVSLALPEISDEFSNYYYLIYVYREDNTDLTARFNIYTSTYAGDSQKFSYTLFAEKSEYSLQDPISLKLLDNNERMPVTDGKLLLSAVNCDIVDNDIFENPSDIKMTYKNEYAPDFCVTGAYFDGQTVYPVQTLNLKTKQDMLNVNVTADKQKYMPGDTVSLQISVTDITGGALKSQVSVSVIDSALKSLFLKSHNINDDVYFSRCALGEIKRNVSTHLPALISDSTYVQGGGSDNYRQDSFEKTACFQKVTTDEYGKANVSFTLPDSVTTWSVNVQAFTASAKVGMTEQTLVSAKDLYLSAYTDPKIKTTDDAVFPIKITSTEKDSQCQYILELLKDGVVLSTESELSDTNTLIIKNYGKLQAGTYTLRMSAKQGSLRDVSNVDFTVLDSFMTQDIVKRTAIESDTKIDPSFCSDVNVTFCDEEYEFYYAIADALLAKPESTPENIIGKSFALALVSNTDLSTNDILQNMYGSEPVNSYFTEQYPVQKMANITAAAGDYFGHNRQVDYYNNILRSSPTSTQSLYALWGLAALGEPVLGDLNTIKAGIDSLSDEEVMCLTLAYAYEGDYKSALTIYNEKISVKIKNANGISKYDVENEYDSENLTELSTILTSKISASQAKPLAKSVLSNLNLTGSQSTVLAAFLNNYVLYSTGENSLIMTMSDGTEKHIEYSKNGTAMQLIAKDEINSTTFTSENGENIMVASGKVPALQIKFAYKNADFDIKLSIENNIKSDSISTLEISAQLPENYGSSPVLRLFMPYSQSLVSYVAKDGVCCLDTLQNSAKMYFTDGKLHTTIDFYCAVPGEFMIEPMLVIDKTNQTYYMSEPILLSVK